MSMHPGKYFGVGPNNAPQATYRTRNSVPHLQGTRPRSGKRTADLEDLAALSASEPWMAYAACAFVGHPDAWFPENGGNSDERRNALSICAGCDVRLACLAYALKPPYPDFGIWGGTTPRQRAKLLGKKGTAA